MKFTKIPADTFKQIQLNAGILASAFTPTTGTVNATAILGATTGGLSFTATPEFSDFGDDIDNCPKNTKELKHLDSWTAEMSGTFVTVTAALAKTLVGAGDIDGTDTTKIVPRNDLAQSDFSDVWLIGDYSDLNGETNGGFCAVHLLNSLSTGGFQIQTSDRAKGNFAFTFTGHYSIAAQDTVPFEIYVKAGTAEPTTPATP